MNFASFVNQAQSSHGQSGQGAQAHPVYRTNFGSNVNFGSSFGGPQQSNQQHMSQQVYLHNNFHGIVPRQGQASNPLGGECPMPPPPPPPPYYNHGSNFPSQYSQTQLAHHSSMASSHMTGADPSVQQHYQQAYPHHHLGYTFQYATSHQISTNSYPMHMNMSNNPSLNYNFQQQQNTSMLSIQNQQGVPSVHGSSSHQFSGAPPVMAVAAGPLGYEAYSDNVASSQFSQNKFTNKYNKNRNNVSSSNHISNNSNNSSNSNNNRNNNNIGKDLSTATASEILPTFASGKSSSFVPSSFVQSVTSLSEIKESSIASVGQPQAQMQIFFCEPCDKEFSTKDAYEAHIANHETCSHPGCTFTGTKKVLIAHFHGSHGLFSGSGYKEIDVEGQKFRVLLGTSPEEVEQWRAERRKKFPTHMNVEKRKLVEEELIKAGGFIGGQSNKRGRNDKPRGKNGNNKGSNDSGKNSSNISNSNSNSHNSIIGDGEIIHDSNFSSLNTKTANNSISDVILTADVNSEVAFTSNESNSGVGGSPNTGVNDDNIGSKNDANSNDRENSNTSSYEAPNPSSNNSSNNNSNGSNCNSNSNGSNSNSNNRNSNRQSNNNNKSKSKPEPKKMTDFGDVVIEDNGRIGTKKFGLFLPRPFEGAEEGRSLYSHLVKDEIVADCNAILQCFRFFCKNNFLQNNSEK